MKLRSAVALFTVSLLAVACAAPSTESAPTLAAVLQPTRGNSAAGTVWLSQDGSRVSMRGRIGGLKPGQQHGFHVHEVGDCSSADGMSAGGHLNPTARPHGPPDGAHHAGDLPALTADAAGNAVVNLQVEGTLLGGGAGDIAGKSLVVHASPDDYATQPTGNSGARIACGVVSTTAGRDAEGRVVPAPPTL